MLAPGTTLGPYHIVAVLGTGGMGEVYRARDSRLGREVAIKVSAERFSDRFDREARAIAALNHPHICTLYDVGPNYLVMELVEGVSLADRIKQGPIALDEALRIANQIADALDAAHSRGIVHRDLKPANVKVTPDGVVKVLDFGLAKLAESGDGSAADVDPEMSPTMHPATRIGTILGTAAYMSPEQARGRAVDKRADIWAFGVVLYEMVTGVRLFHGDTASDTIASVLTLEPAWDNVPQPLRPLIRQCLVKDPKQRLRDIGDLPLLLASQAPTTPARRSWVAWSVAAAALVAFASITGVHLRERPAPLPPLRFQIPPTITVAESGNVGLSPDGRQLAFLGSGPDGAVRLWIRSMDSLDVRPLAGSETAANAPPFFWSPDGRFIAFDSGGVLKRISVDGGLSQAICDLPSTAIGGSWNALGDILIGNVLGGILKASERGGAAVPITSVDPARKEGAHILPSFLSDGRHFVYERVSRVAPDQGGIYVGDLDAKPEQQSSRRLLPYAPGLAYAPPTAGTVGHILFVREGTLVAQPFDERRLDLAGDAVALAQQVGVYLDTAFFTTSRKNVVAYRTSDPVFPMAWYDRRGTNVGTLSDGGPYTSFALSPDGSRVVTALSNARDRAPADLWLLDVAGVGSPSRITFNANSRSDFPIWSPDGKRIVFRSGGSGQVQLRQKVLNSASEEVDGLPNERRGIVTPTSWSPDGRTILYARAERATGWDLWTAQIDESGRLENARVTPFATSRFNELDGRFSPDGRWVSYVSNESGANEVYVRAFSANASGGSAAVGAGVLVSKGGGTSPRWRRDGKELFYLSSDGRLMSVAVTPGAEFRAAPPTPLFQAPPGAIFGDPSPDGQRFLMVQTGSAPFTVVVNWASN